jgi:RNA polymerase sigma-70 factor (ECF subfamily)
MDTTRASVYSALRRAHRTIEERLHAQSQQATLRALGDTDLRALVAGYVDAWERGDVDALAAMLIDDATVSMPPYAAWYRGREAIATFLARHPMAGGRGWPTVPHARTASSRSGTIGWTKVAARLLTACPW